jgi:uncharacterized cupin superfamily protein
MEGQSDRALWFDALGCTLEMEALPAEEILEGSPSTGSRVLFEDDFVECGVWEMFPGVARDVEVDEVFVVISGEARLLRHRDHGSDEVDLRPGVTVVLREGEETTWSVSTPLRKVYWVRKSP